MCVGLAEVRSRQRDFSAEPLEERLRYLASKPVPLVMNVEGELWMVDRHHRLRALVELDPEATAFGYVVARLAEASPRDVLQHLRLRGWLYLYDGRGLGPLIPFHEFRWGAWLRKRPLPPFTSDRLDPALPAARALVASPAAAKLAGWLGPLGR